VIAVVGGGLWTGLVVLAITLMTCFVLYYFVSWKYLSKVWGLS
jgi:hypothetical protein